MVLTWETLNKFNLQSPPTYTLGRSDEIQEKYDKHRTWIKNSGIDVKKYIYDKFNLSEKEIIFIENDFPYNCENGVKHYIIWISDKYNYNTDQLEKFIKTKLKVTETEIPYIFYKNIPKNNSIACVNHYHVFAKVF